MSQEASHNTLTPSKDPEAEEDHPETRNGYQKTKLGWIPEDWEVKRLDELFSFKNGVNAGKESYGSGVKFINVLEILENNELREEDIPGSVEISEKEFEENKVLKGDVLFNRTSETRDELGIAAVYMDEEPVIFGGFVIRARPLSEEMADEFKRYGFSSPLVRKQIIALGNGAVRMNIGQKDLGKVLFPLPPLPQQRRIADILATWDRAIEQTERLIEKKEELKKGLIEKLVTGKKRMPGFSGEWEEISLDEVGDLYKGKGIAKKDLKEEGYPCILYGEIYTDYDVEASSLHSFIDEKTARESFPLKKGDILIASSGEKREDIGKAVTYNSEEEAYAGGDIIILRNQREDLDSVFLSYQLNSPFGRKQIERLGEGHSVVHVYKGDINDVKVNIPSNEEQKLIVNGINILVNEINEIRKRKKGFLEEKSALLRKII